MTKIILICSLIFLGAVAWTFLAADTTTLTTDVSIGWSNNEAMSVVVKETDLDSAETVTSDYFSSSFWDGLANSVVATVICDGGNDSMLTRLRGSYYPNGDSSFVIDTLASNKTTWHQDSLSILYTDQTRKIAPYWAIEMKGIDCSNATAISQLYRQQSDALEP